MMTPSAPRRPFSAVFTALGLLLVTHCATANSYPGALTRARGALGAAQAAQAGASPLAERHLQQARTQLQQAERLQQAGHPHRAINLLHRAEADAQLALALMQHDVARAHNEEQADRLQDLETHQAAPR